MPHTSMMNDSHREGRSFRKAILLGGWYRGRFRELRNTARYSETHLKQRIRKEERSQRYEILLVRDVQVVLQVVQLR